MTGSRKGITGARFGATMLILALSMSVSASSYPDFDVRGLKLAMTPAQAQAAIRVEGLPATQPANNLPVGTEFFIDEVRINKRDDLQFISSMISQPRLKDGSKRIRESVVAVFTPPPGATQAWGIGYRREYLPQDMPQIQGVLERLVGKYGQPSWSDGFQRATYKQGVNPTSHHGGIMLWYWDTSGRQLGPNVRESCRAALHNSYILLGGTGDNIRMGNTAVSRSTLFTGATETGLRAGCSRVVRAMLQWTPEGLVRSISVEAMDVALARSASDRLVGRLAQIESEATQGRVNAAARNKPDF